MMGRIWIVALAILVARFRQQGRRDHGRCALLAAFTVYFVISFFTRGDPLGRRDRAGRAPHERDVTGERRR